MFTRARVLAVDDDVSFLGVLRALVRATDHLAVAGEAASGEAAVASARDLGPDVVLMDVGMPGMGGIRAAERIQAAGPSIFIIMVSTMHPDDIPLRAGEGVAGAVLWKSTLAPRDLDELWLGHRARTAGRSA